MGKNFAYIQISADRHDESDQLTELVRYANFNRVTIAEFIEVAAFSPNSSRQRRISTLMARLATGDALLVTELAKLGRSTGEVVTLLNRLIVGGIRVTIIKENLHLSREADDVALNVIVSMLAQFARLEEGFVSLRMKEALVAKKMKGVTLGKPKGTIQASIYDKDRDRIQALLKLGVSQRRISKAHLGYGTSSSLGHYIRTRGLQIDAEPTGS